MTIQFISAYDKLISALSHIPSIYTIGKTGGNVLPDGDESDIDIMIICDTIPPIESRREAVTSIGNVVTNTNLNIGDSPYWGVIDFVSLHGVEVCFMYHTFFDIETYVHSVLHGERLEKEGGYFYPTGRIASLLNLYLYVDKEDRLGVLRDKMQNMPASLARTLTLHHLNLSPDREDFLRAATRKDILFHHLTIENALDHFLQALYALNMTYFPSRKRTWEYIEHFEEKPLDCSQRLTEIIALSAQPETLAQSYDLWVELVGDLQALVNAKYIAPIE